MRIVFMATGDIALPAFRSLLGRPDHHLAGIVCQPDKPVGRKQVMTAPLIKQEAQAAGVPVLQPEKIKRSESVAAISKLSPDVIVVMAYGQIVSAELLELPQYGCINLHASILPRHRGASPVHAAVLAGDKTSGVTAMQMDAGMDTGDILHTESIRLARRETAATLHDKLGLLAPRALAATLDSLTRGSLKPQPQDDSLATHAGKLNRESGRIDWSTDCCRVDRLIRGMFSWPGAFTEIDFADGRKHKLKVHAALPFHRRSGPPGEILKISSRGIEVACGQGALVLRRVQLDGRLEVDAATLAQGYPVKTGMRLR